MKEDAVTVALMAPCLAYDVAYPVGKVGRHQMVVEAHQHQLTSAKTCFGLEEHCCLGLLLHSQEEESTVLYAKGSSLKLMSSTVLESMTEKKTLKPKSLHPLQ